MPNTANILTTKTNRQHRFWQISQRKDHKKKSPPASSLCHKCDYNHTWKHCTYGEDEEQLNEDSTERQNSSKQDTENKAKENDC